MSFLLLFDIDGTLVLTGGAGRRAMARAFEELFRIPNGFTGIPMAGRTDQLILADAMAHHGIPWTDQTRLSFRQRYCELLRLEIESPGEGVKAPMPGVTALLDRLHGRSELTLALLTGNYHEAARIKLEHFGLWHHFQCGAYGDEAADRNGLVPLARSRAAGIGWVDQSPDRTAIIGDTPLDMMCARSGSAKAIGVTTGGYDAQALFAAGADHVFDTLEDSERFLQLFK